METYEGTWKLEGDQLMLTLHMGEQSVDLVWSAELQDNLLNLSRKSPDGSVSVINSFKRK
jgi:hypothetical protein